MRIITQAEFDTLPIVDGYKQCPKNTDYSLIKVFYNCHFGADYYLGHGRHFIRCRFSDPYSFGSLCCFEYGCIFDFWNVSILKSDLGCLSDKITHELMKRDQETHPFPEMFDKWGTEGGKCPYSLPIERMHFFVERKECWNRRFKRMSTVELIRAICKEKKWGMPYLKEDK